ncbi:hypothetical protein OKW96_08135 [Sphingobacterium sp. KU25419]|nr:hypothetical protein OKW96_08135 [Sphingobacterium sp. KU25419]
MNRAEAYLELGNNAAGIADMNLMASNRIDNYNVTNHAVTPAKSKLFLVYRMIRKPLFKRFYSLNKSVLCPWD